MVPTDNNTNPSSVLAKEMQVPVHFTAASILYSIRWFYL